MLKRSVKNSITVLLVMCFTMLSMLQVSQAMSQEQLDKKRAEMRYIVNHGEFITYSALYDHFGAGKEGNSYNFVGRCIGTNESGEAIFEDANGNRFQLQVSNYQLKVGTLYTVNAIFSGIYEDSKGIRSAGFTFENAHLPYLSEYGL